ncbi:MAG: type II toxin-antitoxin system HicB family antitoxin [Elusimicrobiota bacterium]|nr:type II toxin-antitoxin system HicB family antitoxin [Elusimicrobiota bacterium]
MKRKTNQIRETEVKYKAEKSVDYPIVFEENEDCRWTVACPILPGCISEGDTKKEATENIKDAIQLYLRAVNKEMQIEKRRGAEISKVAVGV